MTLVAHVSDLHLDGTAPRRDRVERVSRYLRALSPDRVLVTGDVADHGDPAEYAEAVELLDGLDPLVVPGNHDDRNAMADAFGPADRVVRADGTTVALCDSLVPGHGHGELSAACLPMLDDLVDDPDPLVVALHHPPVRSGHPDLDAIGLRDPDGLAAVLARRTGPTLVACGHVHLALATTFAGHPLVVAPGVASTLRLPGEPGRGPVHDRSEPGLALHVLDRSAPPRTVFRIPPPAAA